MKSLNLSLFPLDSCPPVSDEEFNLFHSIDRELFTRLIHNLGRDPAESMHVMALWMWLEKQSSDMNLIKRLLSLPPNLLNELADEGVVCLKCAEEDRYPFGDGNPVPYELALLPNILTTQGVGLRFFHENRTAVLRGVTKIVNTVCARAFNDILKRAREATMAPNVPSRGNVVPVGGVAPQVQFMGSILEAGELSRTWENRNVGGGFDGSVMVVPPLLPPPPPPPHGVPMLYQYPPYLSMPFVPLPHHPPPIGMVPVHMVYDLGMQRQMLARNELEEMFSQNLSISEQITNANAAYVLEEEEEEEEEEVSADDRTIFLTFSKGYPISEDEIREFFTKRFGDFIEELIMQEVDEDEQVLYARMVARSRWLIEGIVGRNKAKYSINGKHVWARKYVKKQNSRSSLSISVGGGGGESSSSSQHH